MKPEVLEHLLHSIPNSIVKDGIAVDITPLDGKQTILTLDREIFPYSPEYNGKTDFVLCVYETSEDGRLESLLKQGKDLLAPTGLFFLLIAGMDTAKIIYTARKNGLTTYNTSIDRETGVKEHCFVFESVVEKENVVEQQKTVCDRSTSKCPTSFQHGLPECCLSHLDEVLSFLAAYFDDNGITYWISNGTLLGAARDGKTIPWNSKANLAYLNTDEAKLANLSKMCSLNGYYFLADRGGKRLFYSRKNLMCVYLTPWFVVGKNLTNKKETIAASHVHPLTKITLDGKEYSCPNNYEAILEQRYGADWQVPHNINGKVTAVK